MWRVLSLIAIVGSPAAAQDFFTLQGHGGPIMDIAVSPDGQIATASFDNAVGLWSGSEAVWHDGHDAAVNAVLFWDDQTLISAGDDFKLRLWRGPDDQQVLGEHQGKIVALAGSPQAGLIASASWDGRVGIWAIADQAAPRFLSGHRQAVNDVVFNADGSRLYSASADGTIRIWDPQTGDEIQQLVSHGFGVNELVLNEAAGWLAYGVVDGGTRVVDMQTGAVIDDFTLERRPILAMAFAPAEGLLAVGDGEGYIMIVDTRAMRIARDFRATQRGPIWALAFSRDGQNIHAGGIENIMYSWPIATMDEHDRMADETRSFLQDPTTMSNGERQFQRKCSICHTLKAGSARRAGPSLHNLFGRAAGTVDDYTYSETLSGSSIIWSAETINALFEEGPDHYIPGSKMPMQQIAAQQDRDDLIAYLRDATIGGEN
ncbi:c-type cytochrome [Yoonia sp. 2307UL14-13]|uniref:c-type cytochrome n=1 Tax=Yoonia sp. 2307UL14-13 TaxID=3126506 RepID=UPI0030A78480